MITLENAFLVHSMVDLAVGIPLWVSPKWSLKQIGVKNPKDSDILMTRLVAGALIAIGVASYVGRNARDDQLQVFILMKIVWSFIAMVTLLIALFSKNTQYDKKVLVILLVFFFIFNVTWDYHYLRIVR